MVDGNLKSKAVVIVAALIKQIEIPESGYIADETVIFLLKTVEDALHEAHALGVEAGREGA